jgi:hypothetical protein
VSNTTPDTKGPQLIPAETKGPGKPKICVTLSVLADGRNLDTYVILQIKNLPREKLPNGITCKYNDKGWMTDLMIEDSLKGQLLFQRKEECWSLMLLRVAKQKMKTHTSHLNTNLVI